MAVDTLKLFGAAARMSTIRLARSRGQALFEMLMDLAWHSGAGIAAPALVAVRFGHIGAWPVTAVIFMLAFGNVASSLLDAMFGYNTYYPSRRIGRGQLDHSLIQPQPIWRIFLTEGFAPFDFLPTLALSAALLAWSTAASHVSVNPAWVTLLVINLAASMTVWMAFLYAWGSLAFWAPRGAEEISTVAGSLLGQINFPLDPVQRPLRLLLVTAVPSGLLSWLPARALLRIAGGGPLDVWITPLAAAMLAALASLLFMLGLRHYRKTGSTRYLDYGHRR